MGEEGKEEEGGGGEGIIEFMCISFQEGETFFSNESSSTPTEA